MDDSLHYMIMANQMLVQKALLEQLKDTGLTIGQPKIHDYLKEHDGSNQKEIAKACFLEAGSLTIILNKMEPSKPGIKSRIPYTTAIVIPLLILSIHVVIFLSSVNSFDKNSIVGDKTIHHRIGLHFRGRNLHFRKIAVSSICTSICSVLKCVLVLTNQRTKRYRRKCTDWEWKK